MSEKNYPTPHISARPEDIAETVLMPGDPKRSEFVAKSFLENAVLFNDVRGVKGYTGSWKGHRVSVMASGMGMPSMGIYSYELFNFFGVNNIIRIGSAGAMTEGLKVRDIVLAMGACTNSAFAQQYLLPGSFAPIASYRLLKAADEVSARHGIAPIVGNVLSSDTFYDDDPEAECKVAEARCACGRDGGGGAIHERSPLREERACDPDDLRSPDNRRGDNGGSERQNSFTDMMEIALDTAIEC